MIQVQLFEDGKLFKTLTAPAVPRVGEAITLGYGKDYRVVRVIDVCWDLAGDVMTAQVSVQTNR